MVESGGVEGVGFGSGVGLVDFAGGGETATVKTAGSVSDTCEASGALGGASVLVALSEAGGLLLEDDGTEVRG